MMLKIIPHLKQELPQPQELSSAKLKEQKPRFIKKPQPNKNHSLPNISIARQKAFKLLNHACQRIYYSHLESSLPYPSKTLALAKTYLDTGIYQVSEVLEFLYRIKHTLHTEEFTCSPNSGRSAGIYLGQDFKALSSTQQVEYPSLPSGSS